MRRWLRDHSERFRLWRIERRLKSAKTMADMRWAFGEMGMPLDHLTDAEINVGCMRMIRATAAMGLMASEAAGLFAALALASPGGEGQ
ncbi:hypothetical protein LCGC14_1912680 [marine sediment metagenome]|uniref:Uncharacterized protein n=1 Tax=marine sediment metagenome TaxID=412755 RepID=A0A0F9FTQ3_9ZZZZ